MGESVKTMKLRLRKDLAIVELEGEAVVYNGATGHLHHFNPTATVVLSFCDGQGTLPEIVTEIAKTYSVPATELEAQIKELINQFHAADLLESVDG